MPILTGSPVGPSQFLIRVAKDATLTFPAEDAGDDPYDQVFVQGEFLGRHDGTLHLAHASRFKTIRQAQSWLTDWFGGKSTAPMPDGATLTDTHTEKVLRVDQVFEIIEVAPVVVRAYTTTGARKD